VSSQVPPESGTWGYHAGVSGSITLPSNALVLGIAAHSTAGGSLTINSGDSIPVPANTAVDLAPRGNLSGPTIVFTGTDSWLIEFVQ
jgi:hypothetical protein